MSTRAPKGETRIEESPFFAAPILEGLGFHLSRCSAFAAFVALFWAVPFAAMFVIVGNTDAEAASWMLGLWAQVTIATVIGGFALYALFQFAYGKVRDHAARKTVTARFADVAGEGPDRTLVTGVTPKRAPKPAPAKDNVVHADFRGAARGGIGSATDKRIAS